MSRLLVFALTVMTAASPTVAGPKPVSLGPLIRAFKSRVPDLQTAAQGGDREAQFALSILRAHGLRGVARDEAGARVLRTEALASAPGRQITQYIPGINGQAGHVSMLYLPGDNPIRASAGQVDRCVEVLVRTASARSSFFPDFNSLESRAADPSIEEREGKDAAICGGEKRYSTLVSLWNFAKPWGDRPLPTCEAADHRCQILRVKIEHLNGRDPVAEAGEAAKRGDFRLGAFNHIGPMPRGWDTPGVTCSHWTRDLIGKWHVNQDAVRAGDSEHTNASIAFMAAYNRSLVTNPSFPFPDICSETAVQPAERYAGPVRSFPEAARSGDVGALAAATAAGANANGRDPFDMTALAWAASRNDEPMQTALLERGADPNIHPEDEPSALALALDRKQVDLARLLLAKGARMTGQTGLCQGDGPVFVDPDADGGPKNRKCSWAGLLIAAGQFDLLDQQAAAGALDPPSGYSPLRSYLDGEKQAPVVAIDEAGELQAAFFDAVTRKDETVVRRLLPHVGHGEGSPVFVFERLLQMKRPDLVRGFVLARGAKAARSEAEADLWRVAARAGRDDALAFLYDFGGNLNLLPPARLAECRAATEAGAVDRLVPCVRDAAVRRTAMKAALSAGEFAKFDALASEAADVRERNKRTLIDLAAERAPAPTFRKLLARGAAPRTFGYFALTKAYQGAFRTEAEATSTPDARLETLPQQPTVIVARRGDAESLRVLVEGGAKGLSGDVSRAGNLGNPPAGMRDQIAVNADDDSEKYPNSASPESLRAVDLLAAEAARVEGAQSLEAAFSSAVYSGYNDVLTSLLAHGYDASRAKQPEVIWFNWSGLGQPCKPSTGRLLLRAGVPTRYPPSRFSRELPLHTLAANCRNPRSVAVLAPVVGVNTLDEDGNTALDIATRYRSTNLIAALRALGGKTAKEVSPSLVAKREQKARTTEDLDLEQSESQ